MKQPKDLEIETLEKYFTEKVQLWNNGLMMTLLRRIDAIKLVRQGSHKIINSVAITQK